MKAHRAQLGRMSGAARDFRGERTPNALFLGLAQFKFGMGVASSGITASWKVSLDGRDASPRKEDARLFLMNGMTREAPRDLGCKKKTRALRRRSTVRPDQNRSRLRCAAPWSARVRYSTPKSP